MRGPGSAAVSGKWRSLAWKLRRCLDVRTPRVRFTYGGMEELAALKCGIAYNRYGGYCVPASSSHRPAARAVLSGEVYEPRTIEYMIAHCGRRDVVHAGTYFGDFLPALSAALSPDALLWAFEPNHENFRCARITIELNGSTNIRLDHSALGAERQQRFVQVSDPNGTPLGGRSHIVSSGGENRHPVGIVTIDDVVPRDRDVGIIQLDVEGGEEDALSGALATIRRCLPILVLEVRPQSSLEQSAWFARSILSLGYEKAATVHSNSVYEARANPGRT